MKNLLIKINKNSNIFTCQNKLNTAFLISKKFKNSELYSEIINKTSFLKKESSLSERIFCIQNSIREQPKCKECNKHIKLRFSPIKFYPDYCSQKCTRKNKKWSSGNSNKILTLKLKNEILSKFKNKNFIEIEHSHIIRFINERLKNTNFGLLNQFVTKFHLKNKQNILCSILNLTDYLIKTELNNFRWSERFYIIINKIKSLNCPKCSNNLTYNNISKGFSCKKCNLEKGKFQKNKLNYLKIIKKNNFKIITEPTNLNLNKFSLQCTLCGNNQENWLNNGKIFNYIYCKKCEKNLNTLENSIFNFLKSLNLNFIQNTRSVIPPLELDFYFPDKKIAIEFNGNYWHSELNNKDKNYHLNKTNLCKEKGIQLIHIFEDEWVNKRQIVKSRLKHLLEKTKYRIGARKCIIKEINPQIKNKFLNKYHIQGEDRSSIKLGAFYKDRLVAVMTFGKPRFNKNIEYELIRFCTVSNFTIIGIANKLLKYFKKNNKCEHIISYADIRWSNGNVYEKLGFKLSHISKPNYFYCKGIKRESRLKFQKHKLKLILENYNPNLSEKINMENNNFFRIWDCGNLVFIQPIF